MLLFSTKKPRAMIGAAVQVFFFKFREGDFSVVVITLSG
jgi:hypothetical protein